MTLPISYHRLTPEDRAIVSGSWRRGMANGGGPGLLTVATLWAENEAHHWHKHRSEMITPIDRALGIGSWVSTVYHQTAREAQP